MPAVLLVEDEAEVRALIREELESRGLPVRAVDTDVAAYAALEAQPGGFDLLIADINLGAGTTGFDVARRARRLNPALKVIYITGQAAQIERFGVQGGEMFPKPFSPRELADRALALLSPGE